MFDPDDDNIVVGGVEIPDYLLNKDLISFDNYPKDEKSLYILRLIGLHLPRFSDDQKDELIICLRKLLNINLK